ncbi:MAG TPA: RlmE family RNA methyltransferase [Burkholderiales bacterium]|jgi:23S rRNA (uridine2552-2'-O)-methyltransferase|nr:RlmE family RNA methyltransferase [Burkholderiales bacterium]
MARSRRSHAWMQEHVSDPFVKRARKEGYRSRAAFKLLEILQRDRLVKPGMLVVDLGAAPGGWAQVVAPMLRPQGRLVALDVLPVQPIPGVAVVRGDFREEATLRALEQALGGRDVDLVLSDMAPNISGVSASDQARSADLVELALDFALAHLKPGGSLLVKAFQGAGMDELRDRMRQAFDSVSARKPKASRDRSSEFYLLARGLRARRSSGGPGPRFGLE